MLVVPSVAHEYYARALAPLLHAGPRRSSSTPDTRAAASTSSHELRRAGYRATSSRTCETVTFTYICRMEGPATVGIYSYDRRLRFCRVPGPARAEGLYARVWAPVSGDRGGLERARNGAREHERGLPCPRHAHERRLGRSTAGGHSTFLPGGDHGGGRAGGRGKWTAERMAIARSARRAGSGHSSTRSLRPG